MAVKYVYNKSIGNGTAPTSEPTTAAVTLPSALSKGGTSYPIIQDGKAYVVYMTTSGYRVGIINLAAATVDSFVFDPKCDQAPEPTLQGYNGPSSQWVCTPYLADGGILYALTNHGLSNCVLEAGNSPEVTYASCDAVTWYLWEINLTTRKALQCCYGPGAAKTSITFSPDGQIFWGTYCTQGRYYQYSRDRKLAVFKPEETTGEYDRFNMEGAR
jgi:hypothetical protein